MGHRSIPGFCERCGRQFELARPAPGERDLGLDRIQASFRYCASCKLYVGRACCWNPDAVACIVDAPPFALSTTLIPDAAPPVGGSHELVIRRGLAELAASLDAVEHVDEHVGYAPKTDEDRDDARRAWDDAWWAMGWLIARAETSRDAAAKELRRVSAHAGASTTDAMTGELNSLVDRYSRARATIEARLVAAGRSLARRDRRRGQPAMISVGALAAVVVLAFGSAALLQLGYLNPFSSNDEAVASHRDGAVLGGVGGPGPSNSAASTPAPPEAVIARLDFDVLRIGPLAGASEDFGPVAGTPEVVAFPSPFDRSIRLVGDGSHRFCVPTANLEDGRVFVVMDLYAEAPIDSGRLKLSMAPLGAGPTAANIPLNLLDDLRPQTWHQLSATWTPPGQVAIVIGDAPLGKVKTLNLPPAHDARAVAGTVCVAASRMSADAVLLLDNLRVEQ